MARDIDGSGCAQGILVLGAGQGMVVWVWVWLPSRKVKVALKWKPPWGHLLGRSMPWGL